jgi:hypothetical protein
LSQKNGKEIGKSSRTLQAISFLIEECSFLHGSSSKMSLKKKPRKDTRSTKTLRTTGWWCESAIEVLKMRGAKHEKMVAMQISDEGITVFPDQEVFGAMG